MTQRTQKRDDLSLAGAKGAKGEEIFKSDQKRNVDSETKFSRTLKNLPLLPLIAPTGDAHSLAILTRAQEEATREICRRLDAIEKRIGENQGRSFPENRVPADEAAETDSEDDRTRMPEIPEGLMAFAFAMGGETDED